MYLSDWFTLNLVFVFICLRYKGICLPLLKSDINLVFVFICLRYKGICLPLLKSDKVFFKTNLLINNKISNYQHQ